MLAAFPSGTAKRCTLGAARRAEGCGGEHLFEPVEETDLAYKIIASQCTSCSICEFECPNAAISMKGDTFVIDAKKCTECEGHFDKPKCDEVCPVPGTCVPA